MNCIAPIWQAATRWPDAPALVHSSRTLGYREMHETALLIAAQLQRKGVRAQHRVAVAPDHPVMHLLCLLALAHLGAISAPAYRHARAADWQGFVQRNGVQGLICSPGAGPWPDALLDCIPRAGHIADASLLDALPAGHPLSALADLPFDALWRIGHSSGTTGQPKCIARTHGDFAACVRQTLGLFDAGPGTRLMPHMDLASYAALRPVLFALTQGGAVVLPDSPQASDCLKTLQQQGVTHLYTSAWLASELAHALPTLTVGQRLTPTLRHIMMGGAAPEPGVCARLLRHLSPRLTNNYGTSETGALAVADLHGDNQTERVDPAHWSPLTLLPWVQAEATDARGDPLPPGTEGALRYRVEHTCTRYEDDAVASAAAFQDGWFYPGDWGSVNAQGQLTLGARQDERINLGGIKLDPHEVEAVVRRHPSVQACAVVALTQPRLLLVAAIVPAPGTDAATLHALPTALHQACTAALPSDRVPSAWITLPALPRNAQGKLMRSALVGILERDLAKRPA